MFCFLPLCFFGFVFLCCLLPYFLLAVFLCVFGFLTFAYQMGERETDTFMRLMRSAWSHKHGTDLLVLTYLCLNLSLLRPSWCVCVCIYVCVSVCVCILVSPHVWYPSGLDSKKVVWPGKWWFCCAQNPTQTRLTRGWVLCPPRDRQTDRLGKKLP